MTRSFVLGLDQGTSGSKAVVIDREGRMRGYAYRALARLYPSPDWVEQDPLAVAQGVAECVSEALGQAGCRPDELAACGIAGQRNTDFAWEVRGGRPIGRAITWQDMRTLPLLAELAAWPLAAEAHYRLGYPPAPYMSAFHLAWRLRHDAEFQAAAHSGNLRLGLSAAWLLAALGQPTAHQMDTSLVQATGLYDFRAGAYWTEWLAWLGLSAEFLPRAAPTLADYGVLNLSDPAGRRADVPVLAMIGDQQASLFGHNARQPGDAECTHGTASYVKLFLGERAPFTPKANVYYAWHLGKTQTYCLEADATVTGAALRWMQESAHLFADYRELETLATGVSDAGGVVFVPAFTGLNVPYHDPRARAAIFGLTLGSTRGHLARAFYEAIGLQLRAIVETLAADLELPIQQLLVSGGVSASDLACQLQADLTGLPVSRPTFTETTAWAAALLAGIGAGLWRVDHLPPLPGGHTAFEPQFSADQRDAAFDRWQKAVALTQAWGRHTNQEAS